MNRKAIIFGIKGFVLTNNEKYIIRHQKPWGIILFSRNIKNYLQLKLLIKSIRKQAQDKKYPILIDQEGGLVSRLDKIFNFSIFSQNFFGKLYNTDYKIFKYYYKFYINKVCEILNDVGININTVPVLDVRGKSSKCVIGNRSFSTNQEVVTEIGKYCINLYAKKKVASVIKHIPGYGLAKSDSHYKLPIVSSSKKELTNKDFKPFKKCKSFFAMTAHVIYKNYDSLNTATHSKKIIDDVIRRHMGFKGILMSDDISMKALKFGLRDNTTKALDAGCNLILHCNANIKEMVLLSKIVPKIDKHTEKKTSHFYDFLG